MDEGYDNDVTATRTAAAPTADGPAEDPSGSGAALRRRRGPALEAAILESAWAELSEAGYAGFSVEAVAARARTGKASIYRRWPTKQALVLDALCTQLPQPADCGISIDWPDSVTTREALMQVARVITEVMRSPAGDAMRAVKCEAVVDPELARQIDIQFQTPRREVLMQLLRRGVERGEVRPEAACRTVADVIPAVLTYRIVIQREPLGEDDLTAIITQIFLPLVEAR